jgi:hypothetical protein
LVFLVLASPTLEFRKKALRRKGLGVLASMTGTADKGDIRRLETAPRNLPFVYQAVGADRST